MKHPDVRYEKSDANVGAILAFGLGLIIMGILVHVTAAWLMGAFQEMARRDDVPLPTLPARKRLQLPRDLAKIPAPVLQESEAGDLERVRRAEDVRLNSFGWVDERAGVVHIPIAQAMRLLADRKTAEAHGIRVDPAPRKGGGP